MTEKLLALIAARHPLTEVDAKDMSRLKAGGMTFTVRAWRAQGLGHVSVMRASGMLGLMKMDTLVINPDRRDLPLYSYDRIHAMGNDTLIAELYDTLAEPRDLSALQQAKEAFAHLPADYENPPRWYDELLLKESIHKKGKKAQTADFDALALRQLEALLALDADLPEGGAAVKKGKTLLYTEGLLAKGGPSTDVFKKTLGEEFTARFFREVFFGTAHM